MSKRTLGIAVAIGTISSSFTLLWLHKPAGKADSAPIKAPPAPAPPPASVAESVPIERGDTLDRLLDRTGVDLPARVEMISAIESVFDVKKFRAGTQITLSRGLDGSPERLKYIIDPDHELELSRSGGSYRASVVEIPGEVHVLPVCGTLQGSLFESVERAGEKPDLAMEIAQIFAWDLDFYTDPQPGDRFCILVEKKEYGNGQPPTYGRILAARYENAGTVYEGYLFSDRYGEPHYYSADGRSLEAAFLRSPLKFDARISSHFSLRRFHPILKIYRPHLGTDYAAPTGTPVQAVASGQVVFSGRSGASGNLIRIRHANGYESLYMHLSRRFVRAGQRVTQGRRIGAVGATGLATGPHLDFRLRRDGRYVNFERFKAPRAAKLRAAEMRAFAADRDRFSAIMRQGLAASNTAVAAAAASQTGAGGGSE